MLFTFQLSNIWNQPFTVTCMSGLLAFLAVPFHLKRTLEEDLEGPCGEFFLTLGDWDDPGLEEMSPEDSTRSNSRLLLGSPKSKASVHPKPCEMQRNMSHHKKKQRWMTLMIDYHHLIFFRPPEGDVWRKPTF